MIGISNTLSYSFCTGVKSGLCACVLSRISCVRFFATPWTIAHQAPRSWDSSGKNTGVGSPPPWGWMPSSRGSCRPRDRNCVSAAPALQADSVPFAPPGKPLKVAYPLLLQYSAFVYVFTFTNEIYTFLHVTVGLCLVFLVRQVYRPPSAIICLGIILFLYHI